MRMPKDAADRIDEPSTGEGAWTLPIDECGDVSGVRTHDMWTRRESDWKRDPEIRNEMPMSKQYMKTHDA